MTATTFSNPAEVATFSFIEDAIKGFRARAARRKQLLKLDDTLLRSMGLTRLDVLHGSF